MVGSYTAAKPEHVRAIIATLDRTPRTSQEVARRANIGLSWQRVGEVLEGLLTSNGPVVRTFRTSTKDRGRTVRMWARKYGRVISEATGDDSDRS